MIQRETRRLNSDYGSDAMLFGVAIYPLLAGGMHVAGMAGFLFFGGLAAWLKWRRL